MIARVPSVLCAAFLALALVIPPASALPADRAQPIEITADKAVRNEREGVTVYTGNVEIRQGSLLIEADKVTVYRIEAEADKIVAEGNPARMQQRPGENEGMVHARGLRIEYYKQEQRINLLEEATIEQDGSSVAGDEIEYLISEELVTADSRGEEGENRVKVFIPAEKVDGQDEKQSENDDGATDSQ